jgi:hypothetical protein
VDRYGPVPRKISESGLSKGSGEQQLPSSLIPYGINTDALSLISSHHVKQRSSGKQPPDLQDHAIWFTSIMD